MKPPRQRASHRLLPLILLAAVLALAGHANAQPFAAEIRGILGAVSVVVKDGSVPLRAGMTLPAGSVVQTGSRSAVDLYLGKEAGWVRLTENSSLALDKLEITEAAGAPAFNVQLDLRSGSLLGTIDRMSPSSKYHLKQLNGVAGLIGGEFRAHAQGHFVMLDGAAILVTTTPPGESEPVSFTLKTPPAVFYVPGQGVKPAPPALVKEVTGQLKARLPKK